MGTVNNSGNYFILGELCKYICINTNQFFIQNIKIPWRKHDFANIKKIALDYKSHCININNYCLDNMYNMILILNDGTLKSFISNHRSRYNKYTEFSNDKTKILSQLEEIYSILK